MAIFFELVDVVLCGIVALDNFRILSCSSQEGYRICCKHSCYIRLHCRILNSLIECYSYRLNFCSNDDGDGGLFLCPCQSYSLGTDYLNNFDGGSDHSRESWSCGLDTIEPVNKKCELAFFLLRCFSFGCLVGRILLNYYVYKKCFFFRICHHK